MRTRLRVKEVAQEKGFSMGKLSRASDVSYRTIKLIFSEPDKQISTHTLGKLAAALGVDPGELLEILPDD